MEFASGARGNTGEERRKRDYYDCSGIQILYRIEEHDKKLYVEEGIRIKVRVLPDNQAESVIQMMINSGDYPDMLDANIPHIYNLINPCRYLADFTEESWVSKLTNPQQVTYSDGRIYGFPFLKNSGVGGIIYNKDIFENMGLLFRRVKKIL